jgi:hypothetical protein
MAVFIFAIVISSVYGAYRSTFRVTNNTESLAEFGNMGRISLERISGDLEALYSGDGGLLQGERNDGKTGRSDQLTFTSTAHLVFNQKELPASYAMIRYRTELDEGSGLLRLYRIDKPFRPGGDQELDEERGYLLCDSLAQIEYSYLDAGGHENEGVEQRRRRYTTGRRCVRRELPGDDPGDPAFRRIGRNRRTDDFYHRCRPASIDENHNAVTGYRRRIFAADDRGMALLITIMILSLLIVVTLEFGKSMRQHHLAAANLKGGEQLAAIARSGISVAKALLEQDGKGTPGDTFFDEWATLAQADLSGLFNEGSLRLTVSDLSGRVQINSLAKSGAVGIGARQILNRLLISGDFAIKDDSEARAIVNSLVDWIDTDDQELDFGAENSYYGRFLPPMAAGTGRCSLLRSFCWSRASRPTCCMARRTKKHSCSS